MHSFVTRLPARSHPHNSLYFESTFTSTSQLVIFIKIEAILLIDRQRTSWAIEEHYYTLQLCYCYHCESTVRCICTLQSSHKQLTISVTRKGSCYLCAVFRAFSTFGRSRYSHACVPLSILCGYHLTLRMLALFWIAILSRSLTIALACIRSEFWLAAHFHVTVRFFVQIANFEIHFLQLIIYITHLINTKSWHS